MGLSKPRNGGIGGATLEPAEGDSNLEGRSDLFFKSLKPRTSQYKEGAGRGMYLLVMPTGAKYWRLKYRIGGKEPSPYTLGTYPEVTLAEARRERDKAREWLRKGLDPKLEREAEKARARADQNLTFAVMAEEWFTEVSPGWSKIHRNTQRSRLDREILPYIGAIPIRDVRPAHVLELLERIHKRGAQDVTGKVKIIISHVFRHAVVPAGIESNPVDLLKGRLQRTRPVVHRKRVDAGEMPTLFEHLSKVPAEMVTRLALYYLVVTASRTGEVRYATWREVEESKGGKLWRVPAARMKMKREHLVPLPTQATKILKLAATLRTSQEPDELIFPGFTRAGPLSENALLALLARAGFFGRQTTHGFRGSFSTWAHESAEANPDVIELCLAHVQGGVRGDYNDAKYLTQRRELLQQWADHCVKLGMVIPK